MKREHLLFTDWEVTNEGKMFGIDGVDKIKEIIKQNLVTLNVISNDKRAELESAVSPP